MYKISIIALCFLIVSSASRRRTFAKEHDDDEDEDNHMRSMEMRNSRESYNIEEQTAEFWKKHSLNVITNKLKSEPITNIAKNVILFVGDGMSIPTLAAARTFLGQRNNKPGEETELVFEKFPYTGLSKTYCVNAQVADSACSATAYLGGVKGNKGTIGVTAAVSLKDCITMQNISNHVYSIAHWSQLKGKRTGLVTTTRVTHASPAGVYAHAASRSWEHSAGSGCSDIATQLVHGETGKKLNVILGGGRREFLPRSEKDKDGHGYRHDNHNLIEEWKALKKEAQFKYVWNRTDLLEVPRGTDFLLGLFAHGHIPFNLERDPVTTPSLAEMTESAIKQLSQGENGYFLFVEGGRIDQAHHKCMAQKALDETIEFAKAVETAVSLTNVEDTLIIVTSDHAHTMSISGFPARGSNILGVGGKATDSSSYSTLSYANGPGYKRDNHGKRHDFSKDDYTDKDYRYPALAPLSSETHGGDDVGIFARGPWAHLLTGVMEQSVIAHVMNYASCVGETITACDYYQNVP